MREKPDCCNNPVSSYKMCWAISTLTLYAKPKMTSSYYTGEKVKNFNTTQKDPLLLGE
jgi:hypothetical protein